MVDNLDGGERLLVATLPINAETNAECPLNASTLSVGQRMAERVHPRYNYFSMDVTNMEMTRLQHSEDSISQCHQGVCCSLHYQTDPSSLGDSK